MKFSLIFCCVFLLITRSYERFIGEIPQNSPDIIIENIHDALMCRSLNSKPELQSSTPEGIYPEGDKDFNAFFGCIWKRKGIIDDQGALDLEKLEEYLKRLITWDGEITEKHVLLVRKGIEECVEVGGTDYGDRAVKVSNCIINYFKRSIKIN